MAKIDGGPAFPQSDVGNGGMTLRDLLAAATKGPWNLVWWGNETFPYPLSILADEDGSWITCGGQVSSQANARLIALAPQLAAALIKAEDALTSIAANTCCDGCQEAALVARAALSEISALTGGNDD